MKINVLIINRSIRREQDANSPHCYLACDKARMPRKNSVIADIGAAEGVFALDAIESAKKIYLFECDAKWVKPLKKTFAPWREKVEIVEQFVGNKVDEDDHFTTLDAFFKDREVHYIKADIEGAEEDMLRGGKNTFQNKIRQAAICAYHRQQDEEILTKLLKGNGFEVTPNAGYVVMLGDSKIFYPPYLRKGVVYAEKDMEEC